VITFGCNDDGALGRDTSKEGSEMEPGKVDLEGHVVQITAGDSHTAALLADGKVYAWGSFRVSMHLPGRFFLSSCPQIGSCHCCVCCRTQVG
jgi:alpha-tubulin suppressor-like RCC1 family protein